MLLLRGVSYAKAIIVLGWKRCCSLELVVSVSADFPFPGEGNMLSDKSFKLVVFKNLF